MVLHPLPVPHAHGCPLHLAGQPGVSLVSCRTDAAEHGASWHAACDPLVAQAVASTKEVAVPAATLATITAV